MSNTPFMPLWVSDFIGDTLELDAKEIGAYMLLLMSLWQRGGELPNDTKKLQRVARIGRDWPKVWAEISRFFEVNGDTISNNRLTFELQKVATKRAVNAQSGSLGGSAKRLKNNNQGEANAKRTLKQPEPYPEPKEKDKSFSKKNITKKDFDIFWELYPKKVNKKKASEVYSSKIKASKDPDQLHGQIAEGLRHYIDCKPDYQDWMHPTTFLNGERWNDRYPEPQRQGGPHGQQSHNSEPSVSAGMAEAVARLTGEQRTPDQTAHTGPTIDLERDRSTGAGGGNANYH